MSTYGSHSPLGPRSPRAGARLVHRTAGRLRRFLSNHPNGLAPSVDEFQCDGTSSENRRPGVGDLRGIACRSESGFRDGTRPRRVRLAPTHDSGWRWTEFLDGRLLGRFCRSTLVLASYL